MSSSDESFGWSAFAERPTPVDVELRSPATEVAGLLERVQADLAAERAATRRAVADGRAIAAEHAVLVFHLGTVLARTERAFTDAGLANVHRGLSVVKEQMAEVLKATGLEVVDPRGTPFADVVDVADIVGWRHGAEFESEVVAETEEPIIRCDGEVVRHGRVIMGAPQRDEETA